MPTEKCAVFGGMVLASIPSMKPKPTVRSQGVLLPRLGDNRCGRAKQLSNSTTANRRPKISRENGKKLQLRCSDGPGGDFPSPQENRHAISLNPFSLPRTQWTYPATSPNKRSAQIAKMGSKCDGKARRRSCRSRAGMPLRRRRVEGTLLLTSLNQY